MNLRLSCALAVLFALSGLCACHLVLPLGEGTPDAKVTPGPDISEDSPRDTDVALDATQDAAPDAATLLGDMDGDGDVDCDDLDLFKQVMFTDCSTIDAASCSCDFNSDGICNFEDLGILKLNFTLDAGITDAGNPCPTAAVDAATSDAVPTTDQEIFLE